MFITITCLKCGKRWVHRIEFETELHLCAGDFCGVCRKEMTEEFEKQFAVKRLRTEEK